MMGIMARLNPFKASTWEARVHREARKTVGDGIMDGMRAATLLSSIEVSDYEIRFQTVRSVKATWSEFAILIEYNAVHCNRFSKKFPCTCSAEEMKSTFQSIVENEINLRKQFKVQ